MDEQQVDGPGLPTPSIDADSDAAASATDPVLAIEVPLSPVVRLGAAVPSDEVDTASAVPQPATLLPAIAVPPSLVVPPTMTAAPPDAVDIAPNVPLSMTPFPAIAVPPSLVDQPAVTTALPDPVGVTPTMPQLATLTPIAVVSVRADIAVEGAVDEARDTAESADRPLDDDKVDAVSLAPEIIAPKPIIMAVPVAQPVSAPAATDPPTDGKPAPAAPVVAAPVVPPQIVAPALTSAPASPPAPILTSDPQANLAATAQSPDMPLVAADPVAIAAPDMPAPVKAEAVSLLQLVRDHMSARTRPRAQAGVTGVPASVAKDSVPDMVAQPPVNDRTAMPTPLGQTIAMPATGAAMASAIPSVDLSASLNMQVVDMGVSGQWIDGLARDIAGLSANGAQGRFQINADRLGPIQVDIRQGEDGADVSLTVATEAAELALRQDSDRLKLDAGLLALRIGEVKVERAAHVAETARADSTGNQAGSQQQSQSQSQGQSAGWQGQGMGQSSAQSHMQGRGQPRENIALNHKGDGDPAVLNHERVGDSAADTRRARYA